MKKASSGFGVDVGGSSRYLQTDTESQTPLKIDCSKIEGNNE